MESIIPKDVFAKMQELELAIQKQKDELKSYKEIQVKTYVSGIDSESKKTKIQELKQEFTILELKEKELNDNFKKELNELKIKQKTLSETLSLFGYIQTNGLNKTETEKDNYILDEITKTLAINRKTKDGQEYKYSFNYELPIWQKELKSSLMKEYGLTYSQVNNIAFKASLFLKEYFMPKTETEREIEVDSIPGGIVNVIENMNLLSK